MELRGGEKVIFTVGGEERRWRVSKVDGNVVKFFEENGTYNQMPYTVFMDIITRGNAVIQPMGFFDEEL